MQKFHPSNGCRQSGMTFVEILVVLAILGGLLAVTILKVVPVLARGKYAAVALAADQLKKATVSYITKPGTLGVLPISEGAIPAGQISGAGLTPMNVSAAASIDQVFVAEGIFEKNLSISLAGTTAWPVGTGVVWNVSSQRWTAAAAPTLDLGGNARAETTMSTPLVTPDVAAGANFNLSGDGVTMLPLNAIVEYIAIPNCTAQAAWELSNYVDGAAMTPATNDLADAKGAVAYATPVAGFTTVFVYVTHL